MVDKTEEIKFPSKTPQKLCYAIRDALAVVKALPETSEEKKYTVIVERYKLRVKADCIVFEPRQDLDFADPITALVASRSIDLDVPEALTLIEVVGAVVQHKAERTSFPNAKLAEGDFDRLTRWATLNQYEVTEIKPLTLSKKHGPQSTQNSSAQSE